MGVFVQSFKQCPPEIYFSPFSYLKSTLVIHQINNMLIIAINLYATVEGDSDIAIYMHIIISTYYLVDSTAE